MLLYKHRAQSSLPLSIEQKTTTEISSDVIECPLKGAIKMLLQKRELSETPFQKNSGAVAEKRKSRHFFIYINNIVMKSKEISILFPIAAVLAVLFLAMSPLAAQGMRSPREKKESLSDMMGVCNKIGATNIGSLMAADDDRRPCFALPLETGKHEQDAADKVSKNGLDNRVTISGNRRICSGQSTTLTASGGNSYVWSTGATTSSITVSPLNNTTYRVTATFAWGATASASFSVNVNGKPNVTIAGQAGICWGGSATLTATGGNTYLWSTGSTFTNITVSPTVTTSYSVTTTNANGCTSSTSRTLTVTPSGGASITGNLAICSGSSTTLTASGGGSYLWSTGATGAAITVSPANNTVYTVTVSAAQGCSATASALVQVYLATTPSISVSTSICAGAQTVLTAAGGSSFAWSTGQTTTSITVSPAATTTYTVTISNGGGCSSTATSTITVNPVPPISFGGPTAVCPGASATVTASGGSSYIWNTGATTSSVTLTVNATTVLTVIVGNASGCTASASRTITVYAPPPASVTAGPSTICSGGSSTLTAMGGVAYLWNTGDTGAAISVNPALTTTYSVTVSDVAACTTTTQATITVLKGSITGMAIGSDTSVICPGDTATLTASLGTAYLWSNGATGGFVRVSPLATTVYGVTVTTTAGCTVTASHVVAPREALTVSMIWTDETCPRDSNGTATLVHNGISFAWSNGATDLFLSGLPPGVYTATVTGAHGCTLTASATIGTVPDNTPPTLSPCPSFPTLYVYNTYTVPNFLSNMVATDNCPTVLLAQSPPAGTVFHNSQIVWVTITAMDGSNNTTQCSFQLDLRIHNCGYIFVDQTATGLNNGFNWTDAFTDLQSAIAVSSSSCDTILVAAGQYSPGLLPTSAYVLKPLVPLYGGFPNGQDSVAWAFSDRDPELYPTVFDGGGISYRVFSGVNLGSDPKLSIYDGFTVQGAYDNGMFIQAAGASQQASPIIRNVVFQSNNGNSGGGLGLFVINGGISMPKIMNCTFSGNTARSQGGGLNLLAQSGSTIQAEITDCSFLNNSAYKPGTSLARGAGLGVHAQGVGTLLTVAISECSFFNNSAQHVGGGLMNYSRQGAVTNVVVENCRFEGNSAFAGGGLYTFCQGGSATTGVSQTDFFGNAAISIGGGLATYCELNGGSTAVNLENILFEDNMSGNKGGALANLGLKGGIALMNAKKCRFDRNLSSNFGSTVSTECNTRSFAYPGTYTETNLENCLMFRNNQAVRGGALYNGAATGGISVLNVAHLSAAQNNAQFGPGVFNNAIFPAQSRTNLTNSVFWGNPATTPGPRLFFNLGSGTTLTIRHCSLQEAVMTANAAGNGSFVVQEGNFAGDPMFVDFANGNLTPQPTSPLVDAGMALPIAEDYRGNPRPMGARADIGAYELGGVGAVPRIAQSQEEALQRSFVIFPNPSEGAFTVVLDQETTGFVQIFDARGSLVASRQLNGNNQAQFDLRGQGTGIYMMRFVDGETVVTKPFTMVRP